MPHLSRIACLLPVFVAAAGCSRSETAAPPGALAPSTATVVLLPPASATSKATVGAKSTAASGSAADAKNRAATAEAGLPIAARAAVASGLARGRKFAAQKKWSEAVSEFEQAAAQTPGNPRVLAELGYAAGMAGDEAKATLWNRKALGVASDSATIAQVHFNQGQVEEKAGHREVARTHYLKSLALRPNGVVERALIGLGAAPAAACDSKPFANVGELCACIMQSAALRADLNTADDFKKTLTCSQEKFATTTGIGPAELSAIRYGGEQGIGEHPYWLISEAAGIVHFVSLLGVDFEPGVMGIHNEAALASVAWKKIGNHDVAYVQWKQDNVDYNMGGLQAEEFHAVSTTVCFASPGASLRCPVTLALDEKAAITYSSEPESPEMRADLQDLKKSQPPSETAFAATFTLDAEGLLRVQETRGTRKELAKYIQGVKLW